MENLENINKSATVLWEDEDNRHSFLLVLPDYGLKLVNIVDIDEDTCEITVYGSEADVNEFIEDLEDGSFAVLDTMSSSLEFDEDYEGWLNNEVWWAQKQLVDGIVEASAAIYSANQQ